MNVAALVFMLAGAYVTLGGLLNWSWFMTSRRGAWVVRIIGPQGARLFYIVLGLVLVVIGALAEVGKIDLGSS